MLTRMQFLATRWALAAAMLTTFLSVGISYEAWAQAIHPAQRAIAAANSRESRRSRNRSGQAKPGIADRAHRAGRGSGGTEIR